MSKTFNEKLGFYWKAGYPALYAVTHEEDRLVQDVIAVNRDLKTKKNEDWKGTVFEWDSALGVQKLLKDGKAQVVDDTNKPLALFKFIAAQKGDEARHQIYIVKDLYAILDNTNLARAFKNVLPLLKTNGSMIIICAPVLKLGPDFEKDVQLIEYNLPDEAAIRRKLDYIVDSVNKKATKDSEKVVLSDEVAENAVEAAKGMTSSETENAYALSYIQNQTFDKNFVRDVFEEKIIQIKKSSLMTYLQPDVTFDQVGGLDFLKSWLTTRGKGYSHDARKFGLPYPKGVLLCGVPGCGKTMLAKATSQQFNFPAFQLDVGKLFGKYVGDTENNFHRVINTIESLGRCVVFIDEIEKMFNRGAVSGQGDSGTSSRSFATWLNWLNDRTSPCFIIATCNDHTILPSELKRKGRFDEVFWLDLPNTEERQEIIRVVLQKRYPEYSKKGEAANFDILGIAKETENYTGAEIDACVLDAMFDCFANSKKFNTKAIVEKIKQMVPLAVTDAERIEHMRKEAKNKLRSADNKDMAEARRIIREATGKRSMD